MNSQVAILSAIPAELNGFPEEDWESQILYTGVGKINATKALMEHAYHLKNWKYSIIIMAQLQKLVIELKLVNYTKLQILFREIWM